MEIEEKIIKLFDLSEYYSNLGLNIILSFDTVIERFIIFIDSDQIQTYSFLIKELQNIITEHFNDVIFRRTYTIELYSNQLKSKNTEFAKNNYLLYSSFE